MDLESRLLAQALAEGRIVPVDLEETPRQAPLPSSTIWGPRIDALLQSGRLDTEWLKAHTRIDLASNVETEGPAWEINTSPGFPGPTGRYTELRLVAVGGQGRVYRARDTVLNRDVALKFLRWENLHKRDWLLREGRAQAKVNHPGICPVLEVGELGGEAFLALTWVEGPALEDVLPNLAERARLDLLIQTCEAVHAAHLQGLLHLDLKPKNLLLERLPTGELGVRVSDFGLAWGDEEAPVGRGGTPPYASPEQLRRGAKRPGPNADVYALGVLMHKVLSGHLPHEAEGPNLSPEATRCAAKATALDPALRHATARELSLDLQALREGRPPPSLPTPVARRLGLWALRHRSGALLAGAALLCLAGAVGQVFRTQAQAQTQARLASRFGRQVRDVEFLLDRSYLSPPHDLQPAFHEVRAMIQDIQRDMEGLGPEAQAEGWYAIGRARQLLGEDQAAREALEAAWRRGNQGPECALALGLARAEDYLDGLRNLGIALYRAPHHQALENLRRQNALPAAHLLLQAARGKPEVAGVLAAIRADLEGHPFEAESLATRALESPSSRPWETRPWRMLVLFWEYRAQACIEAGDLASAQSQLDKAWSALGRGLEAARSDPALRLCEGWLHFTQAYILELRARIPAAERHLRQAVAAFTAARQLQTDLGLAWKYELDGWRRIISLRRRHRLPTVADMEAGQELLAALPAGERESAGIRNACRRFLLEAVLVSWAAGASVESPVAARLRDFLHARTSDREMRLALAEFDLECAREHLRRRTDPRPYLGAARGPLQQAFDQDPQNPFHLEAWVTWCLTDAEARLRSHQNPDARPLEDLASTLETRLQRDRPSVEMEGWIRDLRRMASRGTPVRSALPPGPAPGP